MTIRAGVLTENALGRRPGAIRLGRRASFGGAQKNSEGCRPLAAPLASAARLGAEPGVAYWIAMQPAHVVSVATGGVAPARTKMVAVVLLENARLPPPTAGAAVDM